MESMNVKMLAIHKEALSNSGIPIGVSLHVKFDFLSLELGAIISEYLFGISKYG